MRSHRSVETGQLGMALLASDGNYTCNGNIAMLPTYCRVLLMARVQTIRSKQLTFRAYDHGTNCSIGDPFHETCNQLKYGSIQPPVYDLSKVSAPVVGGRDSEVPADR
jgi:hypothetical protein